MENKFNYFLETVDNENQNFVKKLNSLFIKKNYQCNIKEAKSGYLVSYTSSLTKRVIATFVFRKSGIKLRIYPDHIQEYQIILNEFPDKMKKDIKKASICKRLLDPNDCNPKCSKGYCFEMDQENYQKCRYMAFMLTLNNENNNYIMGLIEKELSYQ